MIKKEAFKLGNFKNFSGFFAVVFFFVLICIFSQIVLGSENESTNMTAEVLEFSENQTNETNEIVSEEIIIEKKFPEKTEFLEGENIGFEFDVSGEDNCSFDINGDEIFNKDGDYEYENTFDYGVYDWEIRCKNKDNANSSTGIVYVSKISAELSKNSVEPDEEFNLDIKIESENSIGSIKIDYGDGNAYPITGTLSPENENNYEADFKHFYSEEGNFEIKINFEIGGEVFSVEKNIDVENLGDTKKPIIDLLYPSDDALLKKGEVEFGYSVEDDVKLENCTFYLYSVSKYGNRDAVIKKQTNKNPKNGWEYEIRVSSLEGKYEWEVECSDNSSNLAKRDAEFEAIEAVQKTLSGEGGSSSGGVSSFSVLSSEKNENTNIDEDDLSEIEEVIKKINDFLDKTKNMGLDEKEVLEKFNILENLDTDKKILINLKQNIEQGKELKRKEFEEIKKRVPVSLEIIGSEEYIKNYFDGNLKEIFEEYFELKNVQISRSSLNSLIKKNNELQEGVSVNVKKISFKIELEGGLNERVLFIKSINKEGKILEYTGGFADSGEIKFIEPISVSFVGDGIYEVKDVNEIIYYVEGSSDLKGETYTILFDEEIEKGVLSITGLAVGIFDSPEYPLIVLLVLILFTGLFFVFRNMKPKKKGKFASLLYEIEKDLRNNRYENAVEKYSELRRKYSKLDERKRKRNIRKIKEVLNKIHEKEIEKLIIIYKELKENGDYSGDIYNKIQKVYSKLPKRYQKKVIGKI